MSKIKATGFTLLEILVSSMILFSAIAGAAVVYKTSIISSEKSAVRVAQASVVPSILKIVEHDMQAKIAGLVEPEELSGTGKQFDINYYYTASPTRFSSPPPKLNNDSGLMESFPKRYILYRVQLDIGVPSKITYHYQQLGWLAK